VLGVCDAITCHVLDTRVTVSKQEYSVLRWVKLCLDGGQGGSWGLRSVIELNSLVHWGWGERGGGRCSGVKT
jgi:hypothetical protein